MIVVLEHYVFLIVMTGLVLTSIPTFIDKFLVELHIFNVQVPTPFADKDTHRLLGFALVAAASFHLVFHIMRKNWDIIPKNPMKDFWEFFHSLFFIMGFARRDTYLGGERYTPAQRVTYVSFVYALGLTIITGVWLVINPPGSNARYLDHGVLMTHAIMAIMTCFIVIYHVALKVRRWEWAPFRSIFGDGRIPIGYARRYHRLHYEHQEDETVISSPLKTMLGLNHEKEGTDD